MAKLKHSKKAEQICEVFRYMVKLIEDTLNCYE